MSQFQNLIANIPQTENNIANITQYEKALKEALSV